MREVLQTRNRAFGPNGVPTTSRQTSATRTDTTSRLPISLGSPNKRYEPSRHQTSGQGCSGWSKAGIWNDACNGPDRPGSDIFPIIISLRGTETDSHPSTVFGGEFIVKPV